MKIHFEFKINERKCSLAIKHKVILILGLPEAAPVKKQKKVFSVHRKKRGKFLSSHVKQMETH